MGSSATICRSSIGEFYGDEQMQVRTDERFIGFSQYGLTEGEARKLCGRLPAHGREKLVAHTDGNYWIGRITFKHDHRFRPITWTWYATLTDWEISQGRAVLIDPTFEPAWRPSSDSEPTWKIIQQYQDAVRGLQ